jgi:hypothetical protein
MTTLSPTINVPKPDQDAVIAVPIANLDEFLPIWTRAISARAINFSSCADDPSVVAVTIARGFATWKPGIGCWVPTVIQPFPYWMDSPSASA